MSHTRDALTPVHHLLAIMARLRDPDRGCPWDVEQTFDTIAPYTLEEAYEVVDAIERRDLAALKDELGDLLLQVVFHARMAAEADLFDFDDVARSIADKLVRRHPHVFGDAERRDSAQQTIEWEQTKHAERRERALARAPATDEPSPESALDDVPLALPSLVRAAKMQKRVAAQGFQWPDPRDAVAKVHEELEELIAEFSHPTEKSGLNDGRAAQNDRLEDELGDVLFAVVALGRTLDVDAETALRRATAKFERRFRRVEALVAADGSGSGGASLDAMLVAWGRVKAEETAIALDDRDRQPDTAGPTGL
jgi:nucleoside triphosphate diphosphatase